MNSVFNNLVTSTGDWGLISTGNLANPNSTNFLKKLVVTTSVTGTLIDDFWCASYLNAANATLTGNFRLIIQPSLGGVISNALTTVSGTVSIKEILFIGPTGSGFANFGFGLACDFILNGFNSLFSVNGQVSMAGKDLYIKGTGASDSPTNSMRFDMNGQNLTCKDITLGDNTVGVGKGFGKLICGNGTHVIAGDISGAGSDTEGFIDSETCIWNWSGNIDFSFITFTKGSLINLLGISKTLDVGPTRQNLGDVTVGAAAIYDMLAAFEMDESINNGKLIVDEAHTNIVDNPSGNGEWEGKNKPTVAKVFYNGLNTFSGTLDAVIFVEIAKGPHKAYYGLSVDKALNLGITGQG